MKLIFQGLRAGRHAAAGGLFLAMLGSGHIASAALLSAPNGGTFTMSLDRQALQPYFGYFLSGFWTGAGSDPFVPGHTGDSFVPAISGSEISALNLVLPLSTIGPDPAGQAAQRFRKGTSADFTIDTATLAGASGTRVGMDGVQGFFAPNWPPNGAGLVNGDFSIAYDSARLAHGGSGWALFNNIYFTMAVYELCNLAIAFTDSSNWSLSGDLLMSPENGSMLQGASLNDVGDFCLGTGSYSRCGQVTAIPVPPAAWLLATGLAAVGGLARRRDSRFP